jgi:transposase
MSMKPRPTFCIPEQTATVARGACPKGNPYLRLTDLLGPLVEDAEFCDLFATRGRAAHAPARLALVTVFQFAEHLTDEQAAEAVRTRLDWKYALALELDDPGFDSTILTDFRARLLAAGAEARVFEAILEAARRVKLLEAGGRQRTDATHVLASVASLNRLELVGETMRHALEVLAVVAPEWLRSIVPEAWYERYERRIEQYRLPKARAPRQARAETYGADGMALLGAVALAPAWLREVPAVEALRRVWIQQFYVINGSVRWRKAEDLPPAARQIYSPHETEARYSKKRDCEWVGYKVHLTETCEPERPNLIVAVETTVASTPDISVMDQIAADVDARGLRPDEHAVDAGYMSGRQLVAAQARGIDVIGPVAKDTSWQAQAGQGYAGRDFEIDWVQRQAVCPEGERSRVGRARVNSYGKSVLEMRFAARTCRACRARPQCTKAARAGRLVVVACEQVQEALEAARCQQRQPHYWERYAVRAGIEGTISQGVACMGMRRARYRGLAKTRLQNISIAAAMNLTRIAAWLGGVPRATTRHSKFVKLKQAA